MNSIPRKIRFLPDLAVECCLTHSLLAILPHNILIWKLFTGMNSFAFISSYSQCHKKGKNMLSECKFFSCLRCFWLREKRANQKSTNSKAKIIKPQKSEKKNKRHHGEECPSSAAELEDFSALGLPTSVAVCQISSQSKFRFLRWTWFAATRKSLQAKYCVTWWGVMREEYCLCHPFLTYLKGKFSIAIVFYDAIFTTGAWSSCDILCCTAAVICWARGKQKGFHRNLKICQWSSKVIICNRISQTTLSNN